MKLITENIQKESELAFLNSWWFSWAMVMGISVWGGITSFLEKQDAFSVRRLFAHLFSSSFAGMMAALACTYAGVPVALTGVISGVAAHMGTPALIKLAMRWKVIRELFPEDPTRETLK